MLSAEEATVLSQAGLAVVLAMEVAKELATEADSVRTLADSEAGLAVAGLGQVGWEAAAMAVAAAVVAMALGRVDWAAVMAQADSAPAVAAVAKALDRADWEA